MRRLGLLMLTVSGGMGIRIRRVSRWSLCVRMGAAASVLWTSCAMSGWPWMAADAGSLSRIGMRPGGLSLALPTWRKRLR